LAVEQLDAGGVIVNDPSNFRFDAASFGGYKLEEMTQPKSACFNLRVTN